MKSLRINVITPNFTKYFEDVNLININTVAGELSILPEHYPLISSFDATKVIIKKNKEKIIAFAGDGLLNVKENEIILICSAFTLKGDIDIERAKKSLERAKNRLNNDNPSIDKSRANLSKKRALLRIKIYEEKD